MSRKKLLDRAIEMATEAPKPKKLPRKVAREIAARLDKIVTDAQKAWTELLRAWHEGIENGTVTSEEVDETFRKMFENEKPPEW